VSTDFMLNGTTCSACAIAGNAVLRIVVSSDSMKNATATSQGNKRSTAGVGRPAAPFTFASGADAPSGGTSTCVSGGARSGIFEAVTARSLAQRGNAGGGAHPSAFNADAMRSEVEQRLSARANASVRSHSHFDSAKGSRAAFLTPGPLDAEGWGAPRSDA
jgi:hypothetical protein